jgi:hypothetical protein
MEKLYHVIRNSEQVIDNTERRMNMNNFEKYDLLELPWTDVAASIKAG